MLRPLLPVSDCPILTIRPGGLLLVRSSLSPVCSNPSQGGLLLVRSSLSPVCSNPSFSCIGGWCWKKVNN
jgi:hypothetical protein